MARGLPPHHARLIYAVLFLFARKSREDVPSFVDLLATMCGISPEEKTDTVLSDHSSIKTSLARISDLFSRERRSALQT
jgi:hypothetical protein